MRVVEHVPGRLQVDPSAARRALAWCGVRRWALVVWGGMALWSAVLFGVVRSDYLGFGLASRFDLGNMTQAVWSTAHGRPLEMTSPMTGEQVVRFAFHVDPVLALLAPLWMVFPTPLMLAAVQIAAVALGALPVFWLGCRHLGSEAPAACLALAYLAYPWLASTAADAIHPVTLAIPLFLWAIWFLDTDRLWPFAVCAVLIAATGELMGLSVAALGLWYALARGHRAAGAAIALLGSVWSAFAVKVIVPAFLGGHSIYYAQYDAVGGSPGGLVKTLFTDPVAIFSQLFSSDNVVYWAWLALPLLGLFLLSPWLVAASLPGVLVNGLSSRSAMSDPRSHYVAAVIPFLIAAAVVGLARLSPVHRMRAAALILGVSIVLVVVGGPFPGTPAREGSGIANRLAPAKVEALRAAIALVPSGEPVTSTNVVHPNLAARRYAYHVPVVGRAKWAVLDTDPRVTGPSGAAPIWAFRRRLQRELNWVTVFDREGVVVLKRIGS